MSWSVQLAGTKSDLDRFAKSFPEGSRELIKDSRGYLLNLDRFDQLHDSNEVHQAADRYLKEFQPDAAVNGVTAAHVWRTNQDGTRTVFVTARLEGRGSLTAHIKKAQGS
jgi:hypothetical protein